MTAHIYDVVIVGAGPGGTAVGYALARRGLDVLLLDKASFPRDKTCGDALTPRAVAVLASMGVLTQARAAGFAIHRLDVVVPNGNTLQVSLRSTGIEPDNALVVPRLVLDDILLRHAIRAGAQFRAAFHVENIEARKDRVVVLGNQERNYVELEARLVVAAVGASTRLLHNTGLLDDVPPLILAVRAYFEGVRDVDDSIRFHFDQVPLPGYGWLFATGPNFANIGAGVIASNGRWKRKRKAHVALAALQRSPVVAAMLLEARQVGPVKGFPIHTDFATAKTFGKRVLLVGEAAGLVNPLTGEGIDYALESGLTAAQRAAEMISADDYSERKYTHYDRLLREKYQRLFEFSNRIRILSLNPIALNSLQRWAHRRTDLTALLIRISLGDQPIPAKITPGRILRVLSGA